MRSHNSITSRPTRCNVVTGLLGAGKASVIRHLLGQRPAGERWAVLLNEAGANTLPAAEPADGNVVVRMVSAGCICCTARVEMRVALTRLLREVRPDRLLIEPVSSALPQDLISLLRAPDFRTALLLEHVLCVVHPDHAVRAELRERAAYREQVAQADVIVINHRDNVAPDQLAAAHAWVLGAARRDAALIVTEHGAIDAALLNGSAAD